MNEQLPKCQCNMRESLVGDGCRYCNPQYMVDHLIEERDELKRQLEDTKTEREWIARALLVRKDQDICPECSHRIGNGGQHSARCKHDDAEVIARGVLLETTHE